MTGGRVGPRRRGARAVALLLCALLASGCAYRVRLSSIPAPAEVQLPDGSVVVTPAEVQFRWVPFGRQVVRVHAPGYRLLVADLRKQEIRGHRYITDLVLRPATLTGAPRGNVGFVLVPLHGPAGTWEPEDVP